jgi:hypothetical protein
VNGELNLLFVAVGAVSLLAGIAVMAVALCQGRESPKGVAMLIAGMMVTAFGLLMAGFAIAFATGEPVEVSG